MIRDAFPIEGISSPYQSTVLMPFMSYTEERPRRAEMQGRVAAVRIVEMIAGERCAPVFENSYQGALSEILRHKVIGHVRKAEAATDGIKTHRDVVEYHLPFDTHVQFMPALSNSHWRMLPCVGMRI